MVIGLLEIRLSIPEVRSLKEKRMVLSSVKERVRNRFNVSIAEVGCEDRWRSAHLAAAVVSSDAAYAHRVLEKVARHVEGRRGAVLIDYSIQML